MYSIAVVDDDKSDADIICEHIRHYERDKGESFQIYTFTDAVNFLTGYKAIYDAVFMDIGMPYINGMDAAKAMRELDPSVPLIFETSLKQYAPKGYDVEATGFLVKPVSYYTFYTMLEKVIRNMKRDTGNEIAVHTADDIRIIPLSSLMYIEINGHRVRYRTDKGDIEATGTLKSLEDKLPSSSFARCNSCYLVNLKYVQGIHDNMVIVGEDELQISHSRKKQFTACVLSYFGDKI